MKRVRRVGSGAGAAESGIASSSRRAEVPAREAIWRGTTGRGGEKRSVEERLVLAGANARASDGGTSRPRGRRDARDIGGQFVKQGAVARAARTCEESRRGAACARENCARGRGRGWHSMSGRGWCVWGRGRQGERRCLHRKTRKPAFFPSLGILFHPESSSQSSPSSIQLNPALQDERGGVHGVLAARAAAT